MHARPGHTALRKGRVSRPGQVYLLTAVTHQRKRLFSDMTLARMASNCIAHASCRGDARLLCWVLMPNLWHGLVELGDRDNLSLLVNRMKALTTKRLRFERGGANIWARGFHDRALRRDEDLRTAARYIVANPIRAGLAAHVCDYPYWDCVWL